MNPSHRIDEITVENAQQLLTEYPAIVADKLHALDEARYNTIPTALAARDDNSLTKQEVATLVDWKLSHGTFRPTLKKLVEQNSDDDIRSATTTAFESFAKDPHNNIKSSLTTLTQLKGIGPATASLLLSVYDPERAPFFSDELFRWSMYEDKREGGWDRRIKYNPKEYLELFEKMEQVRERLGAVMAVELEKIAYVLGKRAAGDIVAKDTKAGDEPTSKSNDSNMKKRKAEQEADLNHLIESVSLRSNKMRPGQTPSSSSLLLGGQQSSSDLSAELPDEEIQNTAHLIESRTRGFLAALNARDFDPASPPWQYKSPEFLHEGEYLCPSDLDLKGYLDLWRHIRTANPDMFCKITELTTYVDRKAGYAEVFCNMEITGRPTGIIRTSVAILEFRLEKKGKRDPGEWLCLRFRGVRGVDSANTAEG
ncbi:hypothetical protein PRZ48_012337 [Zasmidium cellare]|uniref:SnoaL-like domain-containing protein n=1 Tax=Zasmidium cellare TaxID=395010 RepID=A0ABR0E4M6_ZASCE|nr:hypothetical protein PRZ48_012337 [Zasmidium cellare]